jgi:hypothetical protein
MIEKQLYRENGKVVTNVTQEEAMKIAEKFGARLTTAKEEQELAKKHGKNSEYFKDLTKFWLWTSTKLIKQADGSYDVYENGEKVGNCKLPGDGLVTKWNKFGLPEKVKSEHGNGTETYWWIDRNLPEIGILRGGGWGRRGVGCFYLSAGCAPSDSDSDGGFRLVRGSVPHLHKKCEDKDAEIAQLRELVREAMEPIKNETYDYCTHCGEEVEPVDEGYPISGSDWRCPKCERGEADGYSDKKGGLEKRTRHNTHNKWLAKAKKALEGKHGND